LRLDDDDSLDFSRRRILLGDHDGARPAPSFGAPELGTRQAEGFAEKRQEGLVGSGLGGQFVGDARSIDKENRSRAVAW